MTKIRDDPMWKRVLIEFNQKKYDELIERGVVALERIAENLERVTGKYFDKDCLKVLGFKQVGA